MANGRSGTRLSRCSFCEKPQPRSEMVVAGEGRAAVCYDCIRVLGQVVEEETPPPAKKFEPAKPLTPREIYSNLETYVIGQERAKKALSVAVYNHYKRIWNGLKRSGSDVELQKTNRLRQDALGRNLSPNA